MNNLALKIICILFYLILTSCNSQEKLLFVRDPDYFVPPFREYKSFNGMETYSLHERYFVFNYHGNKENFRAASIDLLCNKIKDSTKVIGWYNVDFQNMGWLATYDPKDILSADFTDPIAFYSWEISNAQVIETVSGKNLFEVLEVDLDCTVDSKYLYNTSKLNPEH